MSPVSYAIQNGIAELVFNRPEALNAIDVETAQCLLQVCTEVLARDDVRVLVLRGEGRSFMAGGDLGAFARAEDPSALARAIIEPLNQALIALAMAEQPVIAAIHGPVSGAGMSIALGCDLTLAAHDTRLCPAYLAIAASLDAGGSWHLVRQLGLQSAMRIALLNEVITAEQALAQGLVAKVVDRAVLGEETQALALRLAQGPRHAQGQVKALLRAGLERGFAAQLEAELAAFSSCAAHADFSEGVRAFFEKRSPRF